MSEEDFTKNPRFQLILRDAISYRVLRMSKDWQRYRRGLPKTESDEIDIRFLEDLAPAH
jgi:hypothetical protein